MGTRARPSLNLPPPDVILPQLFPRLSVPGCYQVESKPTWDYNCVAWAAEKTDDWWWPDPDSYWPGDVARQATVAVFVEVFSRFGYEPCNSFDLDPRYEKVAIYVDQNGLPTHMARQRSNGEWWSKLGPLWDIFHQALDGLDGPHPAYGSAMQALRRRIRRRWSARLQSLATSLARLVSWLLGRSP